MKQIDRKVFLTLNRDSRYPSRYIVLNDGDYFAEFWEENETDAINRFRKGDY